MFLIKLLQVNAFFVLLSIVSIIWNTSIQHKKVYMFNPISTMGNNTLFCHEDPYVCAKLISALMKTDVLGGGWSSYFIPYHLHFKEGQLQHTTNILFLAENLRKWMFIIGPSLGGGWTSRN